MEAKPLITIQPDKFKTADADLSLKEGIRLEKGAVLTADYLARHEDLLKKYIEFFSAYPDLFLDLITPSDSNFKLYFYQRIVLRAIMRYQQVYVTACLKGDTPILTERGMVPIKDFDPNDRVWSDGEWRAVENLNRREWHGNLCQISAENCFEDSIVTTDDHKFLTVSREKRSKRPGTFWKEGLSFFSISNYHEREEFYRRALREIEPQ